MWFSSTLRSLLATALLAGSLAATSQSYAQGDHTSDLRAAADQVLEAFEARDGARLASLAHPDKGVRFSPSAYVNPDEDVSLSRDEIETFWTDETVRRWGYADGSGDPIELTPAEYAARYILDKRFLDAPTFTVDPAETYGNTVNNAASAYPSGTVAEYYIPPSTEGAEAGIDWSALRLVFEEVGGDWRLVGVIHDEWSI